MQNNSREEAKKHTQNKRFAKRSPDMLLQLNQNYNQSLRTKCTTEQKSEYLQTKEKNENKNNNKTVMTII